MQTQIIATLNPNITISENPTTTNITISENPTTTNTVTSTAQSKICSTCNKSPALNLCSRCKAVRYCDSACQKADWPKHKSDCRPATKEIKRTVEGLEYAPALESVINKILNSKPALHLLEKVLKDGPIKIHLIPSGFIIGGAEWKPTKRIIIVSSSESDSRKLGHILFELANATHASEQIVIDTESKQGKVSREQYVERWEKIEYSALQIATPIIQTSIDEYQWPSESIIDFGQMIKICDTWDKFWALFKESPHANLFRAEWEQAYRASYEKANKTG